jgi:hypothetical protein
LPRFARNDMSRRARGLGAEHPGSPQVSGPSTGPLPRLLPQGIVLQGLLDSFLDLFCGQTGIGTREFFTALPRKGHGVKRLLHGPTLPKRLIVKSTPSSAPHEEGVHICATVANLTRVGTTIFFTVGRTRTYGDFGERRNPSFRADSCNTAGNRGRRMNREKFEV